METLTSPEFVEEFISYFEAIPPNNSKILPNLAIFKKEVKNKTEIDLILKSIHIVRNSFIKSILD